MKFTNHINSQERRKKEEEDGDGSEEEQGKKVITKEEKEDRAALETWFEEEMKMTSLEQERIQDQLLWR